MVSKLFNDIDAVTFDFYDTLVRHAAGRGRGAMVMEYLQTHGLQSDPWEHQVLYDVFEPHAIEYEPDQSDEAKERYYQRLAHRLFRRLNVQAPDGGVAEHGAALWNLLGPASLAVFPDVFGVLRTLKGARYPMAVVSNWQCGLGHFCTELGLGDAFDHVLASAEVESVKPDPEIFRDACRRLGAPPHRVLHVGDSPIDDVDGARAAGLRVVLVDRDQPAPKDRGAPTIHSLTDLPALLGLPEPNRRDEPSTRIQSP